MNFTYAKFYFAALKKSNFAFYFNFFVLLLFLLKYVHGKVDGKGLM